MRRWGKWRRRCDGGALRPTGASSLRLPPPRARREDARGFCSFFCEECERWKIFFAGCPCGRRSVRPEASRRQFMSTLQQELAPNLTVKAEI
jgi:hypothetical protein